jgi:hypothetical protein
MREIASVDDTFQPSFLHHVAIGRYYQHKQEGRLQGVELRDTGFCAGVGCTLTIDLDRVCFTTDCAYKNGMHFKSKHNQLLSQLEDLKGDTTPLSKLLTATDRKVRRAGGATEGGGGGSAAPPRGRGQHVDNIPIICPIPGCSKAFWRYGLLGHVLVHHRSLPPDCGELGSLWAAQGLATVTQLDGLLSTPPSDSSRLGALTDLNQEDEDTVGRLLDDLRERFPSESLLGPLPLHALLLFRERARALKLRRTSKGHTKKRTSAPKKRKTQKDGEDGGGSKAVDVELEGGEEDEGDGEGVGSDKEDDEGIGEGVEEDSQQGSEEEEDEEDDDEEDEEEDEEAKEAAAAQVARKRRLAAGQVELPAQTRGGRTVKAPRR